MCEHRENLITKHNRHSQPSSSLTLCLGCCGMPLPCGPLYSCGAVRPSLSVLIFPHCWFLLHPWVCWLLHSLNVQSLSCPSGLIYPFAISLLPMISSVCTASFPQASLPRLHADALLALPGQHVHTWIQSMPSLKSVPFLEPSISVNTTTIIPAILAQARLSSLIDFPHSYICWILFLVLCNDVIILLFCDYISLICSM